jgi:hypothetical protein
MRRMILLAAIGLSLGLGARPAQAGSIREQDADTQHEIATRRNLEDAPHPPSRAPADAEAAEPVYGLAPGFVQPYGYPLPAYSDGNFGPAHIGR